MSCSAFDEGFKIEPMLYPDIPPLPCIYEEECLDWDDTCSFDCWDYRWTEPDVNTM